MIVSVFSTYFFQSLNFFKSSESGHRRHFRNLSVALSFVIGLMSFGLNTRLMHDSVPQPATARESWLHCIHDIQDRTMRILSDVFSREELRSSSSSPLLYIDPAYMDNAGDNFIVYGSLVFMEKMGIKKFASEIS